MCLCVCEAHQFVELLFGRLSILVGLFEYGGRLYLVARLVELSAEPGELAAHTRHVQRLERLRLGRRRVELAVQLAYVGVDLEAEADRFAVLLVRQVEDAYVVGAEGLIE